MKTDCIEKPLRQVFARYGRFISHHPWPFIILPVLLAIVLAGGFAFMKREISSEYLFTPQNSQARKDQSSLKEVFGTYSFEPDRCLSIPLLARVICTSASTNDDNIWKKSTLDQVVELDQQIRYVTAEFENGTTIFASNVCHVDEDGACYTNDFNDLINETEVTYPYYMYQNVKVFLGSSLGGVSVNPVDNTITEMKALQLVYYLSEGEASHLWAEEFIGSVLQSQDLYPDINLTAWTTYSLDDELAKNTDRIVPYFSITYTILITFAITSCSVFDWVRSKPWLAFCGVGAAGMAVASAFGLLMYAGVTFVDIVAASPFLVIGIGVDDMFVMLAAWRRTDHYLPVTDRMSEAFSEAAMSITITSVTDVLAILIGAYTPFPAVQTFCYYTSLCVTMCFVYQITFFAGCMTMFGRREEANRHCWTFQKVLPKSEAVEMTKSKKYLICCAGGVTHNKPDAPEDVTDIFLMTWFRDYFGSVITKPISKILILLSWVVFISVAGWGCSTLKQGLELRNLAADDSYVRDFYDFEGKYFSHYSYKVQVVIDTAIDSEEKVIYIDELLSELEDIPNFHNETFTVSWLREYHNFAEQQDVTIDYDNFFSTQFYIFLALPMNSMLKYDILPSSDGKNISRFLIMSKDTESTKEAIHIMQEARKVASRYSDISATVYSPMFIFTEQYVEVLPNTLRNLAIATAAMLVVSLLLIPHPFVSIWVMLSILSICIGVIGYMALWDVSMDAISMINLIMCIGFCVDFSAHIVYHFVISKDGSRNQRVCNALYGLGMPILQGSVSTILGVIVLAFSFAYIFRTFFKIMFLVILFGAYHGLLVIPVLLSLIGPSNANAKRTEDVTLASVKKIDPDIAHPGLQNGAYME